MHMLWLSAEFGVVQKQLSRLNPGQRAALCGLDGAVTVVQGPPGTGKSSFITAACLSRVPAGSRILACTATNKAIDSLVAKLEAAGLTQMLCVGSRRAMGEASCRYLMSSVLARDGFVAAAETAIEQHSANVRRIEAELRELPVPDAALLKAGGGKSGGGGGGGGGGRGGRRGKAKGRGGEAGGGGGEAAPNGGGGEGDGSDGGDSGGDCGGRDDDGVSAATTAAAATSADAKKLEARRAEVKKRLKAEQESVRRHTQTMGERKGSTRRQVWKEVRLVACTASAALQAAAMLEPDAVGCLLHGARAALLVGDQLQLPPFSKWKDADTARYTARLAAARNPAASPSLGRGKGASPLLGKGGKGAGRGVGRGAAAAPGVPGAVAGEPYPGQKTFMLTEQYRMHPAINKIVSSTFYFNKLMTAPSTARARQHPLPACFVNVTGGHEEFQERSCFNKKEAEEVVSLALHCVEYLGFSQERINVLSFYNAQRDILERMLARAQLEDVAVLSVDSMQGREADVIILSCVRADVAGGLGFVADARRVNVALSRARESLVVCGSSVCLEVERIWRRSALKGMQKFASARACQDGFEANLPPNWAMPRLLSPAPKPGGAPLGLEPSLAERSSGADGDFDEPEPEAEPGAERFEQRDSGVPDAWDASSDDDAPAEEEKPPAAMEGTVSLSPSL
ncbi:hypothetical protein EMIHUDRAFT_470572 [Emiliania huxleyi CCMP1516]|uniref:AAA+ ATPase domain-containing protein n=2 Tax=Emiliania huxleyi TaxID=2903 RepID=A0A0D3IVD5_EMIH1|nr:hypothetical protein EMIHUDRAFT_470572 [Emiliania huxleyi CCMP1516]EOD15220.1 hypothetical protein EMIHUDRAFT_470572 [Emiliania huxleyi CCMP1516]|eukprot:XP_005767649.1 hypothetical protein EMIHUDRAFT_470572 [Emiliania huxleyi CCMP1516]